MYAKATCHPGALRSSSRLAILAAAVGVVITLPFGRMAVADDAQVLANCPVVGDTAHPRIQAVNTLKRRMTLPTPSDIDPKVTLEALVAPGDDTNRWDDRRAQPSKDSLQTLRWVVSSRSTAILAIRLSEIRISS